MTITIAYRNLNTYNSLEIEDVTRVKRERRALTSILRESWLILFCR